MNNYIIIRVLIQNTSRQSWELFDEVKHVRCAHKRMCHSSSSAKKMHCYPLNCSGRYTCFKIYYLCQDQGLKGCVNKAQTYLVVNYHFYSFVHSDAANKPSSIPESVIKSFPTETVRQGSAMLTPGTQCRVCLRGYDLGQVVRRLPCRHKVKQTNIFSNFIPQLAVSWWQSSYVDIILFRLVTGLFCLVYVKEL